MYEYWEQFDDNSRWKGFTENEKIYEEIKKEEDEDETIDMLNYVLSVHDDYDVQSSDGEEVAKGVIHFEAERKRYVKDINQSSEEEEIKLKAKTIPNDKIEKKLEETFYRVKQNC